MDTRDILLLIATLVNLGFSSAIVFKNPRSRINIGYGFSVVATALWTLGIAMFRLADPASAVAWARFYYISAGFIATYFLYFGIHFPNNDDYRPSVLQHLLLHVPIAIIAYLVFSPSFIAGFHVEPWGREIILGPAYLFYVVFWVLYMGTAFWLMLARFAHADRIEKLQLKFVLGGTLVAAVGGSAFNLFLPLFGNYRYIWVGPYPTLVMVVAIGYAIVKHRILNIRFITTEVFSAALIAIFLIQFFRASNLQEFTLQGAILLASAVFFWLLIRAMNREVEQREKIESLATELAHANEELKKLDASKSEFISIASHQLRAPLTVIKGYVSLLLEGSLGPVSEKTKEAMHKVAISAEQLVKLIADMLDLSRIEGGRLRYNFQPVVFDSIVDEVAKEFEINAKAKGLSFIYQNRNFEKKPVRADPDKIREVVVNLIDNAIKYTSAGRVALELYPETRDGKGWLTLKVQDNGIGISAQDIPKMFTKFGRTEEARRIRPDGMGLGLYVVKKIIDDHGGRVWVESGGLGRGSAFFVELPE